MKKLLLTAAVASSALLTACGDNRTLDVKIADYYAKTGAELVKAAKDESDKRSLPELIDQYENHFLAIPCYPTLSRGEISEKEALESMDVDVFMKTMRESLTTALSAEGMGKDAEFIYVQIAREADDAVRVFNFKKHEDRLEVCNKIPL